MTVGVRPEHFVAGAGGGGPVFRLHVDTVESLGADSLLHAGFNGTLLVVRIEGHSTPQAGHRDRGLDPARQGVLLRHRHRQAALRLSPMAADARRLEELSLNSSAPPGQLLYDGWLLRFSPGQGEARALGERRSTPRAFPLEEKIAHCERVYGEQGLPAIFRISEHTQPPSLDATLAARGYESFSPTEVHAAAGRRRRASRGPRWRARAWRSGSTWWGTCAAPPWPTAAPTSRAWPRCRCRCAPWPCWRRACPWPPGSPSTRMATSGSSTW